MKSSLVLLTLVVCLFTGCGLTSTKTLTERSAKHLLQEKLRVEDQQNGTANYQQISLFMNIASFVDYRQDGFSGDNPTAIVHRFLQAGFVAQAKETRSYPNLAGIYAEEQEVGFHPVILFMRQGFTEVGGTYEYRFSKNATAVRGPGGALTGEYTYSYSLCKGSVSGRLIPDGSVVLQFKSAPGGYCPSGESNAVWRVQRANDGGLTLVGPATIHSPLSPGQMELTAYTYSFTPEFQKYAATEQTLKIGKIEIDDVSNLLLRGTVTEAGGSYAWHMKYNALGNAMFASDGEHGTGTVFFEKRPDETWACSAHEFNSAVPGLVK